MGIYNGLRTLVGYPGRLLGLGGGSRANLPEVDPYPAERYARTEEKAQSGPSGVRLPYFFPFLDPLQSTFETAEHRRGYRQMLAHPVVKPAVLSKIFTVAALDLHIRPPGKKPNRKKNLTQEIHKWERGVMLADFVRWSLQDRLAGGMVGLAWNILSGGLVDGLSVCEKVRGIEKKGLWAGKEVLRELKPKDIDQDLVVVMDSHRTITSLMGLRYNAGHSFDPADFVIYTHLRMYGNLGMSDFRAAYGRWWFEDTVTKLRAMGAEKRALPVIAGEYPDASKQASTVAALSQIKSSNWLAVPQNVKLQVLDIAGRSEDYFRSFVADLREDIARAITGAALQMLTGQEGSERGNSQVHESTSNRQPWYLSACLVNLLNDHETGLIPDLIDANFQAVEEYPRATLGGVDDAELATSLQVDMGLQQMGLLLKADSIADRYARDVADDPADALHPPQPPQGGPGVPPGGTAPGGPGAGGDLESLLSPDGAQAFCEPGNVSLFGEWDEGKHARAHGPFAAKAGANADAPAAPAQHVPEEKADAAARAIAQRTAGLLGKLGAAGQWLRGKTRAAFGLLEKRYGRKTAVAIFAAGQVISWGTTIVGTLATGIPLWLPGSSVWGAAPAAALAEGYLQAKRGVKKVTGHAEGDLSPAQIAALARELVAHLHASWDEYRQGGAERFGEWDERKHSRDHGRFAAHLHAIPAGELQHVAGWPVRRTGAATWRVDTDAGHVTGDAAAVGAHLERDERERGLQGKRLKAALERAGAATEADPLADLAGAEREAKGFQALPHGARVVSLHPNTRGRIGTIVKEGGVNRVKLDGAPGFGSEHVEPLDSRQSWRGQAPAAEKAAPGGGLFDGPEEAEPRKLTDATPLKSSNNPAGWPEATTLGALKQYARQRLGSRYHNTVVRSYGGGRQVEILATKDGYHGREVIRAAVYPLPSQPRTAAPLQLKPGGQATLADPGDLFTPSQGKPVQGSLFAERLSPAQMRAFIAALARERVADARQLRDSLGAPHAADMAEPAAREDSGELADAIADVLGGLLGERALLAFAPEHADHAEGAAAKPTKGAKWDELQHPRGPGGKFISKGSPEAVKTAYAALAKLRTAQATPETVRTALEHLSILTVKQLHDLKRAHRLQASGRLKEELIKKIAERLPGSHYGKERPWEGGAAAPDLGKVYNAPVDALHVDPQRFQYKLNTNNPEGVTDELRGVGAWNPDFAGVISVWRDPADGKTYVVNGHHRHELASRLGAKDLAIRYVDAPDAKHARGIGAVINIAEGRGTAIDAAKYMRDTGVTPDDMASKGISVKGKVAADAAILTKLSDRAFQRVAEGTLDVNKALAVAKHLEDPELQAYLFKKLDEREEAGKDFSPRIIEEMARALAMTAKVKGGEDSLFGDEEVPLIEERAEIAAHVRSELAREVNDWQAVASKRRAGRVGEAGNVLDTDRNKELAQGSARVQNVYDQMVNRKGQVADAVGAASEELAKAKTKSQRDAVKKRALEAVRGAVFKEAGVESPDAGGKRPGADGGGAAPGTEPDAPPAAAADAGGGSAGAGGLSPPTAAPQAQAREPSPGAAVEQVVEQPAPAGEDFAHAQVRKELARHLGATPADVKVIAEPGRGFGTGRHLVTFTDAQGRKVRGAGVTAKEAAQEAASTALTGAPQPQAAAALAHALETPAGPGEEAAAALAKAQAAPAAFAQEVHALAHGAPQTQTRGGTATGHSPEPPQRGARFGDNKVFIGHLASEYLKAHPGTTREDFNAALVAANRQGLVNLGRADLVQAMHPDDVRDSEIALHPHTLAPVPHGYDLLREENLRPAAEFHFLRPPERKGEHGD